MSSKRVLLVGNFLSRHVATRTVGEELAERLAGAGWRVTTTSAVRPRLARFFDIQRTVWRRRRDYEVAQVDLYSGGAFLWAEAACWSLARLGKPFVLTLHGGQLPELARRRPRRVERLLRSAAAVTAPSSYLKDALADLRADVAVLPNPIDLAAYPFAERPTSRPRLVWIRAFHRVYNPEMALRVLAAVPEATLTLIGPDKNDGSLERARALAERLGVGDRAEWMPAGVPKSEVPARLAEADVFLNTSDVDNTPVTVIEAMACGLPVVSTDAGGLPRLVADGADALLVPRGAAEAMAAAVRRLLAEPELAASLARRAREKVEAFDWPRILPRWEALLLAVQNRRGPA